MAQGRLRLVAAAPFAWAALYLFGRALISDPDTVARYNWAEYLVTKLVASACALLAMSIFTRGDVLWKAWGAAAVNWSSFLVLILVAGPAHVSDTGRFTYGVDVARSLLLILGSFGGATAAWFFARAFAHAGLPFVGSRGPRLALYVGCFAVAMVLVWPAMRNDWSGLPATGIYGWARLVTNLADLVSLTLTAPLLLSALSLRGGRLVWPFALIVASNLMWLTWDFIVPVSVHLGAGPVAARVLKETFRTIATLYVPAAGLAQWLLSRGFSDRS